MQYAIQYSMSAQNPSLDQFNEMKSRFFLHPSQREKTHGLKFRVFFFLQPTDSMISTIGYSLGKNAEPIDKRSNEKKLEFFSCGKHEKCTAKLIVCIFFDVVVVQIYK